MSLIIFSHSDYYFLWPVIEECIHKLRELNPIFACNKTEMKKPTGFTKYIEYTEAHCYAERWIKDILPNIDVQHILVVHDVQLIVKCDVSHIHEIMKLMKENNIDRCSLNVFNGNDTVENNLVKLCNLKSSYGKTITPYDVCPAIWKKESIEKIFRTFPNETYRTSELNELLQTFCRNNLKCFGLHNNSSQKTYYCLGRPYHEYFKILHITIKNEITFPSDVYMDMKPEFLYYFEKYKLSETIKINNNYKFILEHFKPL